MKRKKRNYNKHGHLFTRAMGDTLRVGVFTKRPGGFGSTLQFSGKNLDRLAAASFTLLGYQVSPGLKKLGLRKKGHIDSGSPWIDGPGWTLMGGGGKDLSLIITFNRKPSIDFISTGFTFRGVDLKEYKEELCKAAGWELEA